ncbi:MAG: DNA repair protein RecO [Clostridiales bacterium 38-18]|nr:MAG: DNA repair protein RecO [Clostridiales bacterium 38-18]
MYFDTDALVIKSTKSLNNDIFLTLFSRKSGKMEVVANGAKSSKSQLSASSKPFVYGTFTINTSNKIPKVIACEIIDSHFRVTNDLEILAYGNYFIELCNLTTVPNVVDYPHYQLIVELISILSNAGREVATLDLDTLDLLRAAYLIKLSRITGHQANISSHCTSCGCNLEETIYFSPHAGGLICGNCEKSKYRGYKINQTYINLIQYLLIKDPRVIIKTKIHPNYIQRLCSFYEELIIYHNQIKEIKSKNFLEDIKKH